MKPIKKKKCKVCDDFFMPFNSLQQVCSTICAIKFIEIKKTNDTETVDGWIKEKKDRDKLPLLLSQTQTVFNKYIRLRDEFKPCISSSIPYKDDFDAGHLYSVKQYSGLRFNEFNCHGQSIQENRFKEGNFEGYIANVRHRIGDENLNKLQKDAEYYKIYPKTWTRDELSIIKKEFNKKIKEFNK